MLADLADSLAGCGHVEPAGVAQHDVLPDRQRLHQAEVLVDHADPAGRGIVGIPYLAALAVHLDGPAVGKHQSYEHLHQRGLARAVLAEDAVYLAAVKSQVDLVAGHDGPERFGDGGETDGGNLRSRRPLISHMATSRVWLPSGGDQASEQASGASMSTPPYAIALMASNSARQ